MLGTDIVEIARIQQSAERESFLNGIFTPNELAYWQSRGKKAETLAGMFCAKEAAAKALGTGFSSFRPSDVEVDHTGKGAPFLTLHGGAKTLLNKREIHVSIAHCAAYATAVCFIEPCLKTKEQK